MINFVENYSMAISEIGKIYIERHLKTKESREEITRCDDETESTFPVQYKEEPSVKYPEP